jgi:hypothetical protein
MADVFVGSHEKSFPGKGKGAGQNGDPRASSTTPAKTRGRNRDKKHGISFGPIPVVGPKVVDAALVAARGGDAADTLAHRLKDGSQVVAHDGMVAAPSRVASIPKSLGFGREAKK